MATANSQLLVKITGDVSGLKSAMRGAKSEVGGFAKSLSGSFKDAGAAMTGMGKSMTAKVTLPVVAGFVAITAAASNWESAFAGVRKTVDATDAEFAELERQLLDLSKVVPISPAQIAHIAELGGQLGIAKEEIVDFTRVIADMGASTNLSFEDAAVGMAQFVNVTQQVAPAGMEAAEMASRIGSAIVDLGNNFATTEADIMSFARRIAGTSAVMGISQAEIIGWSGAMASMGIQAEAGGTAFSMTLQDMNKAISSSSKELEIWAAVAGVSVDEFSKLFKEDASQAMESFLVGLRGIDEAGGDVVGVLDSLGIKGARQIDTLLKLAGNTDLVSEAMKRANAAYGTNTALAEEAAKRYETFSSQMQILKNSVYDVAVQLGSVLLPIILDMITAFRPLLESFAKFAAAHPGIIKIALGLAAVAAVVGPVIVGLGAIVGAIGTLISSGGAIVGALGAVGAAIAAIGWPITLVVAAIAALYLAWQNNLFGIRDVAAAAWETIKTIFANAVAFLKGEITWDELVATTKEALAGLIEAWRTLKTQLGIVWANIKAKAGVVWENIKAKVTEKMDLVKSKISEAMDAAKSKVADTWDAIATKVQTKVDAVLGFIQKIWDAIAGIGGKIISGIMGAIGGIGGGGGMEMPDIEGGPMAWAAALKETFEAMALAVTENLTAMSEAYMTTTTAILETHTTWLATLLMNLTTHQATVLEQTTTHLTTIQTLTVTVWTAIQTFLITTWALLLATFTTHMIAMFTTSQNYWTQIMVSTIALMTQMKDAVIGIFNSMREAIKDILEGVKSDAYSAGKAIGQALADGLRAKIGAVRAAARALAAAARANLPGSDAKEGPLSDLTASGRALPLTFAKGMMQGQPAMQQALGAMFTGPTPVRVAGVRRTPGEIAANGNTSNSANYTVIINNPVGETSERSLNKAMRRVTYLGEKPTKWQPAN